MELTLQDLFVILLKRLWLIITATALCMILAFVAAQYIVTPKYTSKAAFLVVYSSGNATTSSGANSDLTYSQNVVSNCIEILSQNDFYKELSADLKESGVEISVYELSKSVSYVKKSGTSTITLNIESDTAEKAYKIAITAGDIIGEYIARTYPQPNGNAIGIKKISSPSLPNSKSSPNTLMYTAVGIAGGLVIGIILALIIDRFDVRVNNEDELAARYNLPVLGVIPDIEEEGKSKGRGYGNNAAKTK